MGRSEKGPGTRRPIRTVEADKGVGMSEAEARSFLVQSRSVVKLGTLDVSGDPNIHPVWYYFEPNDNSLYALVAKNSNKHRNMGRRSSVYFDVDDDRWPYKGVRGKGEARELAMGAESLKTVEMILTRYIKKEHPMFAQFLDSHRKGSYVVVKITPRYFSTWDYGKMPTSQLTAGLRQTAP